MPNATLEEVLQYGLTQKLPPEQIAVAVKSWHADTVGEGRALAAQDPSTYWQGTQAVDQDVQRAMAGISGYAQEQKAREFFPDPVQRQQFLSVLESSSWDPDNMDAPPEWQAAGRAVADAGAPYDANPAPTQAGTIGSGPNQLAAYDIRAKEDGSGYEALILPVPRDGQKPTPVIVSLTGDREGLKARAEAARQDAWQSYARASNTAGSDIGFQTDRLEEPKKRFAAATARVDLYTNGPLSHLLHEELDQTLRQTPQFLQQLPNDWLQQFTTRPLASVARSMAQATAGATGLNKDALTAGGQAAVDLQTPGMLRNRYEAGDATPILDQISQGIESAVTLFGPALATKAVGAAGGLAAAGRGMQAAARGAGWGSLYGTAYGSNLGAALQEADTLEATDPARAARIRRLAQWTSLTKAGIELASERVFPDEAKLLRGQKMPVRDIALMPLKEAVEEYVGARASMVVDAVSGQTPQDPAQAAVGGFWGSLPMMGGAAIARALPANVGQPPTTGPAANSETADLPTGPTTPADPSAPNILLDPDAPLPPPVGINNSPPDYSQNIPEPNLTLADVATRAGTVDQQEPNAALFPDPSRPEDQTPIDPLTTPPTAQDPVGTVAEPPETLLEQRTRVAAGIEPAMTVPGATVAQLPPDLAPQPGDGLTAIDTPAGVAILPEASVPEFTAAVNEGRLGEALGYGIPARPAAPTGAVVLRNAEGVEVKAVEVDDTTRNTVKAALHNRAQPGDTLTDESIPQVAAARMPAQPMPESAVMGMEDETAAPDPAPRLAASVPLPPGVRGRDFLPEAVLPQYFTPGRIVPSYSGFDRVISYDPPTSGNTWSVTVREQRQRPDGSFADAPGARDRTHFTHPTYEAAARAGVSISAPAAAAVRSGQPRPARTPLPRPSTRARIAGVWQEIARETTPTYGWTDAADPAAIAAAVSTPESPVTMSPLASGMQIQTRSGPLAISRVRDGVYSIYSATMTGSERAGQRGAGSQAYLAAFLWARNNGYKFISSGLTAINTTRRTSNMLSMALRRLAAGDVDYTSHSDPATEQGVHWAGGPADKLVAMLVREMDTVRAAVPQFEDLSYDRRRRQFSYQGQPIDESALAGFRRNGVGSASIRRAVITQWALDHPVRASRSRSGSGTAAEPSGAGRRLPVGLQGMLYSQAAPTGPRLSESVSNPAKVAQEAVTALSGSMPGLVTERVHFVANAAELEASGYAPAGYFTAEELTALQSAEGFHDPRTGRTVVFTDQVTRPPGESPRSAVARVILHERIGHDGVNQLLATSPEFAARWDRLAARIPAAELDAIAQEEGYGHLTADRPQLALEWLARQVEKIEGARQGMAIDGLSGLPRQLWETLKAWLAKAYHKFSRSPVTAFEVREIIGRAREAALSGNAIPTSAEALQFSLGGTAILHKAGEPFRVNNLTWRTILTGSPLPRSMVETVRATERARKAADQAAAQLGRDLQTAIEAVTARTTLPLATVHGHLNDYMNGQAGAAATLQALDPVLAERARRTRNYLDDLSTAIAQSLPTGGLRNGILQNLGQWMKRSYAAFDPASGWNYDALIAAEKTGQPVNGVDAARIMRDARNFLRTQQPGITAPELEADMRDLMDRNMIGHALAGTSQVRANVGSLMARQVIPPEIRALMGEETNALHRFTQSASFQTQFLQRHEGQRALRTIGLANGLFSTQRGGVFVEEIPGTNGDNQRWTPLAGLWTTPQLAQALRDNEGGMTTGTDIGGKAVEALKWLGNEAKLNKVALNPDSWVVNMLGNVVAVVNGGDVFYGNVARRIGQAVTLLRAGKARPGDVFNAATEAVADAHRQMTARLTASGVLGESFNLRDLESTIPRQLLQWVANDATRERALGAAKGAIIGQAALRGLGPAGRAAGAVAGGLAGGAAGYNTIIGWQQKVADYVMTGPDALGRLTGFMGNLEAAHASGLTGNDAFTWAAERTRNTFPDYGKLPPVMKQLSKLGVMGSFIGFQFEVYRNYGWNVRYSLQEIASKNPALQRRGVARLLGTAAVGSLAAGGLSALLGSVAGAGGDDERSQRFRRWLAASWEKNGNLVFTRFDNQGVTYFNTSYLLPQSTMTELVNAGRAGDDPADAAGRVVGHLWEQFMGGSVNLDPILAAVTNKDRTGRPITTKEGLPGVAARADYAGAVILEPGWAQKLTRLTYALRDAERNGRTFSLEEEAKRLMGVRAFSRNWDQLIERGYRKLQAEGVNSIEEGNRILGENLPGAQQKALHQTNEALAIMRQKIATYEADMRALGVPPGTLYQARKAVSPPRFAPVILAPPPAPGNPARLQTVR